MGKLHLATHIVVLVSLEPISGFMLKIKSNSYYWVEKEVSVMSFQTEDKSLWKHCLPEHNGVKQTFTMKILKYFNLPLFK